MIGIGAVYWASPYIAAVRFARAAAQGDVEAVVDRLDLPRIRNSFARQIVRAYPIDAALVASLDPAARHAAGLIAITYVDAIIAEHLNPDVVAGLLANRQGEAARGTAGDWNLPSIRNFDGAWDVFMSSGFIGPTSFSAETPPNPEGRYRLGFRLIGGKWRLVSIGLPASVVERAIDKLRKRAANK